MDHMCRHVSVAQPQCGATSSGLLGRRSPFLGSSSRFTQLATQRQSSAAAAPRDRGVLQRVRAANTTEKTKPKAPAQAPAADDLRNGPAPILINTADGAIPVVWTDVEFDKEDSRRYRRTVFQFADWRRHRSNNRYSRHMLGLLGSRIARGLTGPLLYVTTISAAITVYETALANHQLPEWCTTLSVAASTPFSLSSFALSLLLVFRTNTSYSRWDEARKIWGGVINRTRDLVRQGETWMNHEEEAELLELLRRWTITFAKSLQTHLREGSDIALECKDVLPADELELLVRSPHRPNYAIEVLAEAIGAGRMPEIARARMDENLTFFEDALGGCERLLRSPIPLSYTRHTSRFLIIWLTFMPFTLYKACGWGTIPASLIVGFLLLGIEEIGVQIEEPFGILPLEAICGTIQANCNSSKPNRQEAVKMVARVLPERSGASSNGDGGKAIYDDAGNAMYNDVDETKSLWP